MRRLVASYGTYRWERLGALFACALLAVMLATAAPSMAAGPSVTSLADSGPGSLRQALVDAAPGDTITFSVSGTIRLASELVVDKSVAISGPGAANLTISGAGVTRIVRVAASGVSISGVALTEGRADNGGGVSVTSTGALALSQCVVSGNTTGVGGPINTGGGGLYNAGALTVTDCTITQNQAVLALGGGGLANTGTATLTRVMLTNNSASDGVGGGGIYNLGALTLNGSSVSGNQASGAVGGGGIFSAGTLQADALTLSGNSSTGLYGGGGLVNWARPASIAAILTRSLIQNNTASQGRGGGILNAGADVAAGAQLTIATSAVIGNTAPDGAGIANVGLESVTGLNVSNSTIGANTAAAGAGGIASVALNGPAQVSLTSVTVANNSGTTAGIVTHGAGAVTRPRNTLLAANTPRNALASDGGALVSDGHNLSSDPLGSLSGPGDLPNTDPQLAPLANYGGPTPTYALRRGSPAIDAGDNAGAAATDQRGSPRLVDGNGDGTASIDIGAFEFAADNVVTTTADSGPGSLRQAIFDANSGARGGVITFNIGVGGAQTISPTSPLPAASGATTIDGTTQPGYTGTPLITLDGGAAGANADGLQLLGGGSTLKALTMTHFGGHGLVVADDNNLVDGVAAASNGGDGVLAQSSVGMTLRNLSASGNGGAGLRLDGASGVSVTSVTATSNQGGGVVVASGMGNTVQASSVTGNTGAGVLIQSASNTTVQGVTISGNSGAGVVVASGTGNAILSNSITGNGSLGIDLGGDGVTLNRPDGGGPNNGQPFPIITWASTRPSHTPLTELQATLLAAPNTTYRVELFDNAACDAAGYGEGQAFIAARSVTTGEDGRGVFVYTQPTALAQGRIITATATDLARNTSEFSRCQAVTLANDTWANALSLPLTRVDSNIYAAAVEQFVVEHDQAKWFRFNVPPNSRLVINVAGRAGNLPVNYDLSLHKDVRVVYSQLSQPQNLPLLTAEAAPDQFLPDQFLPDQFLPDQFLPDQFLPDQFLPDQFLPDQFLPDQFLPDQFLPDQFLPDQFLPDQFLPDQFLAAAYTGALKRSLLAVSARPGISPELITRNSLDQPGERYLRVFGRNGASSQDAPFDVRIFIITGACANVSTIDPSIPATLAPSEPAKYKTLILTDTSRVSGSDADKAAMLGKMATLAARPEVSGAILDLGEKLPDGTPKYKRIAAAKAQADATKDCPYGKNVLASEIKKVIDSYRAIHPVQYLVLAGSDDVIPYYRTPDLAGLGAESEYVPPVEEESALQASLKNDQVLTQEPYGTTVNLSRGDHVFPLPGLAMGRLVETASEIGGMIDAYIATDGVITPHSALVTGYDFVTDAANAVKSELEAGLSPDACQQVGDCVTASSLIMPAPMLPSDPGAWTADDLRASLLGQRNDLVFLAGHFSAGSAVAGDNATRVLASELVNTPLDMTNTLIFSIGCHSGFNIPVSDAIPGVSPEPDWPQAFARKRVTSIVGTGYQYGDTEVIEYAERLYLNFTRLLHTGDAPVAIGTALLAAKQRYLADTPQLRGMHEKSILEATLFGLPMLQVNMPGQRLLPQTDVSIVSGTSPVVAGPGAPLGLSVGISADNPGSDVITVRSELRGYSVALRDENNTTVTARYYAGSNGVVANPFEPLLPLERRNVDVAGKTLRGVLWLGGQYVDEGNLIPLTSSPTTELDRGRVQFASSVFYPGLPWAVNYLDELSGRTTRLGAVPAQYKSDPPVSGAASLPSQGTLRRYDNLSFRLFYSAWTGLEAVAEAPRVDNVAASQGTGGATVKAQVTDQSNVGIQEVWLTYTPGCSGVNCVSQWQSIQMVKSGSDATTWQTPDGLTIPNTSRFIIQAVNAVGIIGRATNQGAYFTASDTPPPPDDRRIWYLPLLIKGVNTRNWGP